MESVVQDLADGPSTCERGVGRLLSVQIKRLKGSLGLTQINWLVVVCDYFRQRVLLCSRSRDD